MKNERNGPSYVAAGLVTLDRYHDVNSSVHYSLE